MTEARIGREYYDRGEYFDAGTGHLTRDESPFRRYRVEKVLGIHAPSPEDRVLDMGCGLSLIHISEPTRLLRRSRMPSSA